MSETGHSKNIAQFAQLVSIADEHGCRIRYKSKKDLDFTEYSEKKEIAATES